MSGWFIAVEKLFGKRSQCFYSLGVKPIHEKRKEERRKTRKRKRKKDIQHFAPWEYFCLKALYANSPLPQCTL